MSNLQDVPLANPEGPPLATSKAVHQHKISSLKRFLRVISFGLLFARKKESPKTTQQQSSSMDSSIGQEENGQETVHEMQPLQINQTTTLEGQGQQPLTAP